MPNTLWAVVNAHAPTTPHHDRSSYIRALVEADLAREGKLPSREDSQTISELLALAEEVGLSAAVVALRATLRTSTPAA